MFAVALVATAGMVALLATSGTATAAPRVASETAMVTTATVTTEALAAAGGVAPAAACGFFDPESYNHCGNTRVVIRAENFWGTDYHLCVGPGVTSLGHLSSWRIVYAVYIGFLC